jgi:hypothetical protein
MCSRRALLLALQVRPPIGIRGMLPTGRGGSTTRRALKISCYVIRTRQRRRDMRGWRPRSKP